MKKITLLLLLLTVSFSFGQVVLTQDFGTTPGLPTGWVNNDIAGNGEIWTFNNSSQTPSGFTTPNTHLYTAAGFSGAYAIFNSDAYGNNGTAEEAALESPEFDASGLTQVVLTFNHFALLAYGGEAYVDVYNGTSWVEVASYTAAQYANEYTYGEEIIDVSSELAGVANAKVRFYWLGDWSYWWAVDNIVVQQPAGDAPDPVVLLSPANSATNISVNNTNPAQLLVGPFEWTAAATGGVPSSYSISLGITPVGDDIGTLSNFNSGENIIYNWAYNTTYYWYITATNISGSSVSAVWSFTTEADPLSIDDHEAKTFSHFYNKDTDVLTLKSSNVAFNNVELYNLLGQQVLNRKLSQTTETINMASLENGIYLAKVTVEGRTQTVKILKH